MSSTRPGESAPDTDTVVARAELRSMVSLAVPVVLVQVGMMAMGFVDTVMAGHVSATVLASVALGNLYFFNVSILAIGTLMALDPLVSQAIGAGDRPAVARSVQRALVLAAGLSVVVTGMILPAGPLLTALRQPAEIVGPASDYLLISIGGVPPFLAFVVFRQSLQAMHRVAPIVWTIALANLLNAALNWVLLYGHLGFEPMGAAGASIATAISRWAMGIGLLVSGWHDLRPALVERVDRFAVRPLIAMLKLGTPIGAQHMLESAAFGAIGLLMGTLGTREMASHQIAITLAAMTFMVPLGVGAAAAVRVGHAVGAGDGRRAKAAARAAYSCGVGFMCLTAVIFLTVPRTLASLFSTDPGIITVASVLIPIAGVFQVFDGGQAVGAGVLRGIGDTRIPLLVMLASYWLVGVPLSAYLAFRLDQGAAGLWWGFVASLGAVAVFLYLRIRVLFAGRLRRVGA